MSEATAKVGRSFGPASAPAQVVAASNPMVPGPEVDPIQFRKAEFLVHIYTISQRSFVVCQPPLVSRLNIPAVPAGKTYLKVMSIPHPFNQFDRESGNGEVVVRMHDARQVAASLVNPNNPSLDQDAKVPDGAVLGMGVDLNSQGIFWSLNDPPTPDELAKAKARRERYYRSLLDRARVLERVNPRELEFTINEDYHLAAAYFGETTSWHKAFVQAAECPLCGEAIKPGVAFHKNSLGTVCIIDKDRAPKELLD